MHLSTIEENFKNFGSDIFQTFYDIATTSEEPLRQFALLRTEVAAQMWLKHYPTLLPSSFDQNKNTNNEEKEDKEEKDDDDEMDNQLEKKRKSKKEEIEEQEEEEEPTPDVILDFIMVKFSLSLSCQ